jgi:hypothetical protein
VCGINEVMWKKRTRIRLKGIFCGVREGVTKDVTAFRKEIPGSNRNIYNNFYAVYEA